MDTNRLISRSEKDKYIAYVGMYADSNAAIWGQYDRMVDFVFENYPSTGQRFDPIAVPLLNTMAHGIELGLKENLVFFHNYHEIDQVQNFDDWTALEKSHDLKPLVAEFKLGYNRVFENFGLEQSDRDEFNRYFTALEELVEILERSSETFRYATKLDKIGQIIRPAIYRDKSFDLHKIKELYEKCKTLFIGAPNSIGHITDFIDFQKGNPDYDAGKGYLYCQKLHYTTYFLEVVKGELNAKMKEIMPGIWFDADRAENFEIQVWNQDIYIIAVDPVKASRLRTKNTGAKSSKRQKKK